MSIQVKKQDLLVALKKLESVLESGRTTLGIIRYIRFECRPDQTPNLILSSTDLELTVQTAVLNATVKVAGVACVLGKPFIKLIESLPVEEVSLSFTQTQIKIETDRSVFHLTTLSAEEFPPTPSVEGLVWSDIDGTDLLASFKKIKHAMAAKDELRYMLKGACIRADSIVGLDGHRLAKVSGKFPVPNEVILAEKAVHKLHTLMTSPATMKIAQFGSSIYFSDSTTFVACQLIQGQFPDFERIIPKQSFYCIVVDKNAVVDAIKRVTIIRDDKSNMSITIQSSQILLRCQNELGDFTERVPLTVKSGDLNEEITILMSATYLQDALESFSGDSVEIHFNQSAIDPVLFKEKGYIAIVMPRRK